MQELLAPRGSPVVLPNMDGLTDGPHSSRQKPESARCPNESTLIDLLRNYLKVAATLIRMQCERLRIAADDPKHEW